MPALRKLLKETPQILEAYRNGSTIREIAEVYKVSTGTVRNILNRNDEPLRPRGRKPKKKVGELRDATLPGVVAKVAQERLEHELQQ
jgi:transposase